MKTLNCLLLCLTTIGHAPAFAQQTTTPSPASTPSQPGSEALQGRLNRLVQNATAMETPTLTKFDLDFRGGTPRQLATAIEKALGLPLNVIVPDEFADTKLPALKMNGVDVSQLF